MPESAPDPKPNQNPNRSPLRARLLAPTSLLVLAVAYWKLRIFDADAPPALSLKALDLYNAHLPMSGYGFGALAKGEIPLWNPYQLFGEPFLATYQTGIFYPLHLVYLLFDVPVATEVSLVLHMLLAGIGMWCLARRLDLGAAGAFIAALTFMWSGNLVMSTLQPTMFTAQCWLPISVFLLDRVLEGERRAWLWLTLACACQLLIGRIEFFVHGVYAGALFALFRMVQIASRRGWGSALRGVSVAAGCLALAALLAAAQLLPTRELTEASPRSPGSLTLGRAIQHTRQLSPLEFVRETLDFEGTMAIGVLSVVALGLALGSRRWALVWGYALVVAILAAGLASGGPLFVLYHSLPFGNLFRTPSKFLDLFVFGNALLVGLAVARLAAWLPRPRARLWRSPSYLVALALAAGAALWLAADGVIAVEVLGTLVLLAAYGLVSRSEVRRGVLVALCALQAASLLVAISYPVLRPARRPGSYWSERWDLLENLRQRAGYSRIYLSPRLWFVPGLSLKQGLRHRAYVAIDYDPLVDRRYQGYIRALSTVPENELFNGRYRLAPGSEWGLMALTGTRYFVVRSSERVAGFMASESEAPGGGRFERIADGEIQVYRWADALPRALFVPRARVLPDSERVLAVLRDPGFDPRAEVLLEEPVPALGRFGGDGDAGGRVEIRSYRPEEVVLWAEAAQPGFVLLSDLHFPGWSVEVNGEPAPMLRANFLFRAVPVGAGASEIRFAYRPASFRAGAAISVVTLCGVVGLAAAEARRRRG